MSDNNIEKKPNLLSHIFYTVDESNETQHWQKIGAAWPTKDDGFSLKLGSIPLNGNVILRSREELERLREQRKQVNHLELNQEIQQKL